MGVLGFKINGQSLERTDMAKVVAYSRNYLEAEFKFSDDWEEIYKVAQFTKDDKTYDAELVNDRCIVPWEVLQGVGSITIAVFGGDLITTNMVKINVYDCGVVGGLAPTEASPGIYTGLRKKVEGLESHVVDAIAVVNDKSDEIANTTIKVQNLETKVADVITVVNDKLVEIADTTMKVGNLETKVDDAITVVNDKLDEIADKAIGVTEVPKKFLVDGNLKKNEFDIPSKSSAVPMYIYSVDGAINYFGFDVTFTNSSETWTEKYDFENIIDIPKDYTTGSFLINASARVALSFVVGSEKNMTVDDSSKKIDGRVFKRRLKTNATSKQDGGYIKIDMPANTSANVAMYACSASSEATRGVYISTNLLQSKTRYGLIKDGELYAERSQIADSALSLSSNVVVKGNGIELTGDIKFNNVGENCTKLVQELELTTEELSYLDKSLIAILIEEKRKQKYKLEICTDTTISIRPNIIYIYAKANPISGINIALADVVNNVANYYEVKFVAGANGMPIVITDTVGGNLLWHNTPTTIAGKMYTLAISVYGEYKEAVLSYAE